MKVIGNLTKDAIIRAAVSEGFTVSSSVGSGVVYEAAGTGSTAIGFDTHNGKVIVAYQDQGNSNYGTAIVGTVSGTSISFGTAVVYESANIHSQRIVFDSSNNKVVIFYADAGNSDYGTAVVGTVSGTSISFGTPVVFASIGVSHISADFDTTANKIVTTYSQSGGKAIVGTVSGTSISFGSAVKFENGSTYNTATVYDTNANKTVIAYRDNGDGNKGKAIVGTVSGTSISYGSIVNMDTENTRDIMASYDPVAQKILFVYKILSSPNPGYSIVGTVSGTSISFGTRAEYHAGSTDVNRVVYDVNAAKHVILFRDQDHSPYRGKIIEATVSGTSVSYSDELQWSSTSFSEPAITYDPDQKKVVFAYIDANNSYYGTAKVYTTGYTSATGGTIADGKAVIVNANGTVSTISSTAISNEVGTSATFTSATIDETAIAFDSIQNKHLIVFRDTADSSYAKAVVATVANDGSITFGSIVTISSAFCENIRVAFDSANGKFLVVFKTGADSNYGNGAVATISGTSVSFGSFTSFNAIADQFAIAFDSNAGKFGVFYRRSNQNYARTATISGTSVSFGSEVNFNGSNGIELGVAFDSTNNKFVVAYRDQGNSDYGECRVATISGTSISFGTMVVFNSAGTIYNPVVHDVANNKIVIAYRDAGNSNIGTAIVGTISGTDISFGSEVTFDSSGANYVGANYDSAAEKVVIAYNDIGDSNKGKIVVGTVSGTSISFGSENVFSTNATSRSFNTFDSNVNRSVIVYRDEDSSDDGEAVSFQAERGNLTTENFVGFMKGAALDGTNGEILSSCSIARNQTSLTAGQTYFVSPTDGALSTSAGSPSVTAGTAISSTEIIVKG